MAEESWSQPRKLSCIHCGEPFQVYPPDDTHHYATRTESDFKDQVRMEYKCDYCGKLNIIYWGSNPVRDALRRMI